MARTLFSPLFPCSVIRTSGANQIVGMLFRCRVCSVHPNKNVKLFSLFQMDPNTHVAGARAANLARGGIQINPIAMKILYLFEILDIK
jgi:hypothetical protein